MALYTPSPNNVAFGRGQLFFDRYDVNGVRSGQYISLGNCDSFAISQSLDKVDMVDYTSPSSAPYASATKSTDVTLKISGFELTKKILAMVFLGDTTTYTQTLQTVSAQTIAPATLTGLLGSMFDLGKRNVTNATLLQGTATLTSGTDWELFNAYDGLVRIKPTGAVVDGTVLTANYVAPAISSLDVVRGGTVAQINGKLKFVTNNATGPNGTYEIWNATLAGDGDFSPISDEFIKWNLTGKILSDAGGAYGGSSSDPYYHFTSRS
jgi:hypothetical protein